jgi:hypothetical protein
MCERACNGACSVNRELLDRLAHLITPPLAPMLLDVNGVAHMNVPVDVPVDVQLEAFNKAADATESDDPDDAEDNGSGCEECVCRCVAGMSAVTAAASAPVASAPVASACAPGGRVVTAAASVSAPVAPSPVPGIRVVTAAAPVACALVAVAPVASAPVAVAPVASAPVASAPVASAPVASAPGNRFRMSARPLLEHFDINHLNAKFGINALDTLQIEQIQGGPNDGMFVAHDAVALLLGTRADHTNAKVKIIVCPVPEPRNDKQREENRQKEENFPSCTLLVGANVSLVHVLT